jgi:hypothetical protein
MNFRRHISKRFFAICFVAAFLFALAENNSDAQEISREYQVKAVFLFNFAHFVNWPTNAFTNAQSPFVIGILGNDPFGKYLDETIRGEKVDEHPLVVEHFQNASEAKDCQILFVGGSEAKNLPAILKIFRGKSTLTVSDISNFSRSGGIIGFVTTPQNKIHFDINLDAAKSADLIISSRLLRLADIVETQKGAAP